MCLKSFRSDLMIHIEDFQRCPGSTGASFPSVSSLSNLTPTVLQSLTGWFLVSLWTCFSLTERVLNLYHPCVYVTMRSSKRNCWNRSYREEMSCAGPFIRTALMSPRWAECHLDVEREIKNSPCGHVASHRCYVLRLVLPDLSFADSALVDVCIQIEGHFTYLLRNKRTGAPIKKPSALDTFISNSGLMKSLRTCHLPSQVEYLSKHPKTFTCLYCAVCIPCY